MFELSTVIRFIMCVCIYIQYIDKYCISLRKLISPGDKSEAILHFTNDKTSRWSIEITFDKFELQKQ